MAVQATYADEASIPELLKKDYVKKGEIYVLQVTGGAPDGFETAEKVKEFRDNNVKLSKQLKAFEGIDPEQVRPALAELEELRKLPPNQKEAIEQRVNAATQKMTVELEQAQKKLAEADSFRQSVLLDGAIAKAARDKVHEKALPDVTRRAREMFKLEGESPVAVQGDTKVLGKSGKPLTIEEWLEDLETEASFLFKGSSGGGTSNGSGGAGGNGSNPFEKGKENYTEQTILLKNNPAKAKALAAAAGAPIPD